MAKKCLNESKEKDFQRVHRIEREIQMELPSDQ